MDIDTFLNNVSDDIFAYIRRKLIIDLFFKKKYEKYIADYVIHSNQISIKLSAVYPKMSLMSQMFNVTFIESSIFYVNEEKNKIKSINNFYITYIDQNGNIKTIYLKDFMDVYYNRLLNFDMKHYLLNL